MLCSPANKIIWLPVELPPDMFMNPHFDIAHVAPPLLQERHHQAAPPLLLQLLLLRRPDLNPRAPRWPRRGCGRPTCSRGWTAQRPDLDPLLPRWQP